MNVRGSQATIDWDALSGPGMILHKPIFSAVAVTGAYSSLSGTPNFAVVATTGAYSDLIACPTFATVATTGAYLDLSGRPSLATVATTGAYADLTGRPAARSQASATRTLNSIFQISATRDSMVMYSVQITVTASIGGSQNGDVILEIASDAAFTLNVQTLSAIGNGQTVTLAIVLNSVLPATSVLFGMVPAGYYARLRTVNNTGSPSFLYRSGQEALL